MQHDMQHMHTMMPNAMHDHLHTNMHDTEHMHHIHNLITCMDFKKT